MQAMRDAIIEDYGKLCRAIGREFPSSDSDRFSRFAEDAMEILTKKAQRMIQSDIEENNA